MSGLIFKFNGSEYKPQRRVNTYTLNYPCQFSNFCLPIETTFTPGQYLFELWGAQGGSFTNQPGGKGGYSRGFLNLKNSVEAFLFIGAEGTSATTNPSVTEFAFNGGGIGRGACYPASSGGGGTDIRILKESIYHRIIVAGGGGGSSKAYDTCIGGSGGGEIGTEGGKCDSKGIPGKPGTQTEGGKTYSWGTNGDFWSGANKSLNNGDGCGGGGGWFGGGAGSQFETSGGGGSGFIFNSSNYENAIKANLFVPSRYFLRYGLSLDGSNVFPVPGSFQNETGHTGNGFIQITYFKDYLCKTIMQPRSSKLFIAYIIVCLS